MTTKDMGGDVVDYDIVVRNSISDLLAQVKVMVKRGWKPFGGISMAYPASNMGNGMCATYAQAMVKIAQPRKWWHIAERAKQ